jgi:hypothetical protein
MSPLSAPERSTPKDTLELPHGCADEMEHVSVVVASLPDKAQERPRCCGIATEAIMHSKIVSNCFRKILGFVTVLVVESVEGASWDHPLLLSEGAICIRSALANSL